MINQLLHGKMETWLGIIHGYIFGFDMWFIYVYGYTMALIYGDMEEHGDMTLIYWIIYNSIIYFTGIIWLI